MNTNRLNIMTSFAGLTLALALFAGTTTELKAQTTPKGATKLIELSGAGVTPQTEPARAVMMDCAKCKDEVTQKVDRSARGANKPLVTVAKHLCESCATTIGVTGHGKAKRNVVNHSCGSCGGATASCCEK